jgi:hypothetical protein
MDVGVSRCWISGQYSFLVLRSAPRAKRISLPDYTVAEARDC